MFLDMCSVCHVLFFRRLDVAGALLGLLLVFVDFVLLCLCLILIVEFERGVELPRHPPFSF